MLLLVGDQSGYVASILSLRTRWPELMWDLRQYPFSGEGHML